jgi:SAM-dependent methyltransferase
MQGSITQKLGRLTLDLLRHPRYLPRCVLHHPLKRRSPLDFEIPWFSYAAIDFLNRFLAPHMTGFEYGSGGSTLFLAKRIKFLYSVEDNSEWFERVSRHLNEKKISNVNIQLRPFDFKNPVGFDKSDYLKAMPRQQFDVIIIDGSEEWTYVRPTCFRYAEQHVRKGGIVVLDDSWRYDTVRANHHARHFKRFQSVGPCRIGVTSTDIFFY